MVTQRRRKGKASKAERLPLTKGQRNKISWCVWNIAQNQAQKVCSKYSLASIKSLGIFMDLAYLGLLEARNEARKYTATVCYSSVKLIILRQQNQETRCWKLYSGRGIKELENRKQPRC